MKPVAEGSTPFLRGVKNPLLSLRHSLSQKNVWAKPYFFVVRKKLLDYFENGLRARLEDIPYYLSLLEGCLLTHQEILPFFGRCR
jgi:hypothetical protein